MRVMNIDEGLDTSSFEAGKIELYFTCGLDHIGGLIGSFGGLIVGYLVYVDGNFEIKVLTAFLLVFVFACSTIYSSKKALDAYETIIFDEDTAASISEISMQKGVWVRKIQAVADGYNLSERQTEILKYLAQGRNAEHIRKELYISHNTAKSHIYSIYRKLRVHSQQELIDMVERKKVQ